MGLGLAAQSFVINRWLAALIALSVIVALLGLAQVLVTRAAPAGGSSGAVAKRRSGIKALVIGADGRASTSKLQAVLWLFAVMFAFVFLFVWGRSTNCGAAQVSHHAGCSAAVGARAAFENFVNRPLQSEYFVLLGFPLTAAVTAKALTVNKIATGAITKVPLGAAGAGGNGGDGGDAQSSGIGQGLAEIVSNDAGNTDLLDFQYFAFNLLTLAYFFVQFLTHPADGLPNLPTTLIGLSGLSAGAYTAKKALETDVQAVIIRVIPDPCAHKTGTAIAINGSGFGQPMPVTVPPTPPDPSTRQALLAGQPLTIVSWSDKAITATIPAEAEAVIATDATATLVVVDSDGLDSSSYMLGLT